MSVSILISGCADTKFAQKYEKDIVVSSLIQPPELQATRENAAYNHPDETAALPVITRKTDQTAKAGVSQDGCSVKDRFDREGALAYNFADGQSRLGFHVSLAGPKFSDPGRFEMKEALLRFTYRFKANKLKLGVKSKQHCLYSSRFQGLLGSVYHELYDREGKNAFDEAVDKLEERGLDFWR